MKKHFEMWRESNKPFGLESIQIRLAGQLARTGELVFRLESRAPDGRRGFPELDETLRTARKSDFYPVGKHEKIAYGTVIH